MAKQCDYGSKYFSGIDECIPLSIAGTTTFLNAYTHSGVCPGFPIKTVIDLESFRYCNVITGDFIITVNDANADFSALYDIREITGLFDFDLKFLDVVI